MEDNKDNKISKSDYHKYLHSLFDEAISKGPEEISKATMQSLIFLTKNYANLTPELQDIADKILDGSINYFDSILKESPDTPEVRQAKKILRILKKNLPSAKSLIMGIESASTIKEEVINTTRVLFEKYLQLYLDILYDISIEQSHSGKASFAKLSMLFSCVDELVCSFHLAQHGYASQSYTHIRTIFETLNKLELFIKDESFADLWSSNDEKGKRKELKPSAVREKIGVSNDPLYSFLSAHGTHTTMEYIQSKSAAKKGSSENVNPEIVFFLGGTKIIFHIFVANACCIFTLFSALIYVGKAFQERIHLDDYIQMMSSLLKDFKDYLRSYYYQLIKGTDFRDADFESLLEDSAFWDIKKYIS